MTGAADGLMFQFLQWMSVRPRTEADVMEVWKSSCPRISIWEDALQQGLVARRQCSRVVAGTEAMLTPKGKALLDSITAEVTTTSFIALR